MGKSSSAPKYATTTNNTGLWGSSTTGESGTTYKPTEWMKNTMGTIGDNLNSTLSSMFNNDYTQDANFKAYQDQLNKTMGQNYDATVLAPLANRGLMRSSGLQAATNSFANTLANNTMNLYDNYYNRLQNNLSNSLNTSNALFDYMTGATSGSRADTNAVNAYNQWKYQMDRANNASNNALWGQLAGAAAGMAGTALGGPIGGALAQKLTSTAVANAQ